MEEEEAGRGALHKERLALPEQLAPTRTPGPTQQASRGGALKAPLLDLPHIYGQMSASSSRAAPRGSGGGRRASKQLPQLGEQLTLDVPSTGRATADRLSVCSPNTARSGSSTARWTEDQEFDASGRSYGPTSSRKTPSTSRRSSVLSGMTGEGRGSWMIQRYDEPEETVSANSWRIEEPTVVEGNIFKSMAALVRLF